MPGGRSPWWGALAKRLPLGRAAEEVTGKSACTGARGVRSGEYRVGRDSEVGPRGAALPSALSLPTSQKRRWSHRC